MEVDTNLHDLQTCAMAQESCFISIMLSGDPRLEAREKISMRISGGRCRMGANGLVARAKSTYGRWHDDSEGSEFDAGSGDEHRAQCLMLPVHSHGRV